MSYSLKTKVCVVGSGFCGYAAYKKLLRHGIDVIVVEGGELSTPSSALEQTNYHATTNSFVTKTSFKKIKHKKIRMRRKFS